MLKTTPSDRQHQPKEEPRGMQSSFQSRVQSLCNVIREMGNPLLNQSGNLLLLDTQYIMDATFMKTVRTVKELSQKQFQKFRTTRLNEQKNVGTFRCYKRNKKQLFRSRPASEKITKDTIKITSIKINCSLFGTSTSHVKLASILSQDN